MFCDSLYSRLMLSLSQLGSPKGHRPLRGIVLYLFLQFKINLAVSSFVHLIFSTSIFENCLANFEVGMKLVSLALDPK